MSTIKSFRGIRYSEQVGGDVTARIAPPYDVLDESDKDRLLQRDPHNFVKVDLPHMPPKAAGPEQVYREARETLDRWLAEGVMVQDDTPALYAYHQEYTHDQHRYVRKMFFAALRLEPFGEGSIFPHEQTFGGPKEDRLALTKATQANMSPIFALYQDEANEVARRIESALADHPLLHGELEGTENRLWRVTDQGTIDAVAKLLADKPVFIADGHHRTGTAMMYRDWLRDQQGGELPSHHPANFVLCVLCAMEDPGLLILPTHRVLPGISVTADQLDEDREIEVKPLDVSDPATVPAALSEFGPQALCLYHGGDKTYTMIRPTNPNVLAAFEPDHTQAWHKLGLSFLHAYVIERIIKPNFADGADPQIEYVKADAAAAEKAEASNGIAFLMQPTTMEELRAVCQAGDLMPQKSTFFYPKLASGLVIKPLDE